MQVLKYFSIIIAVTIILFATYAIVILCELDKYKNDLTKQTEFCKRHSKQFLTLFIISIILSICISICYAFLVIKDANNRSITFIMVSMFVSIVPLIIFFVCFVYPRFKKQRKHKNKDTHSNTNEKETIDKSQSSSTYFWTKNNKTTNSQNTPTAEEEHIAFVDDKETQRKAREDLLKEQELERKRKQEWEQYKREKEERERLERERIQKEKEEQERKSTEYLEQNKNRLISKYSGIVENFIKKLEENGCAPFLEMFSDSDIPLSSILIYPYGEEIQYKESATRLLHNKILRDGLKFTKSTNESLNSKIQELTDYFIKGLKKRIAANNEWDDEYTFFVLLYLIVRNNVIKYYHDKYIEELDFKNLETFCKNIPNALSRKSEIFAYTYYHIYETNIDLPFVDTYHKICLDIKYTIAAQKEKELEDDLFGTPKKESEIVTMDKSNDLSPIKKVDLMTGEEFEIFMEEYFTQRGYKVIRTPLSGDYGIDLIIEHEFGKVGVQAKCYSNKVSLPAVQEVVAGLRHYGLSSGMVVTNNYFQPNAIRLAKDNNIELWDRDKLIEKLG